ncbi:hypothetical protein NHF48_001930 [Sphingomonas sp. H160509]|uniref:hypothetical protein n=1 Tax=Sphingomonas sp. H160509 TaxID=2955313 RepID=UPI002097020F|nr:hypothetical protein [Sphingomonas sp. H160509]MDD1449984.1 hypothetical protein [Sphingomonas sp. H160509]
MRYFLFNADGTAIWQIDPETGTTENRLHDFDRSIETTEPFVNVWNAYGEYYASRMNGDSFRLDLASGLATYRGWPEHGTPHLAGPVSVGTAIEMTGAFSIRIVQWKAISMSDSSDRYDRHSKDSLLLSDRYRLKY